MKLSKLEIAAIVISLAFVFIVVGFFAGRSSVSGIVEVETQYADGSPSPESEVVRGLDVYEANRININTATKDELCLIKGIGEALADRIIDYRTRNGGFDSPADIMNVKGIGGSTYDKIKDYITVE